MIALHTPDGNDLYLRPEAIIVVETRTSYSEGVKTAVVVGQGDIGRTYIVKESAHDVAMMCGRIVNAAAFR